MRSLSASIDAASKIVLLGMLSCASVPPSVSAPEPAVIEGEITVSGKHPYNRQLILVGDSGDSWLLEAEALEGEFLGLDGRAVRIYGDLRRHSSGSRTLTVDRYELVSLPGLIAAAGQLESSNGKLSLRADPDGEHGAGRTLIMSGPLSEALGHFIGYRVWITGERVVPEGRGEVGAARTGTGQDVPGIAVAASAVADVDTVTVIVREYGVLGPAMRPDRGTRRSTDPDSCR